MAVEADSMRADKWLWHARFLRSRSEAAAYVAAGHIRRNGERISKPAAILRLGDVLTFALAGRVRVIRVKAFAERRGNAAAGQALYDDLEPAPCAANSVSGGSAVGSDLDARF